MPGTGDTLVSYQLHQNFKTTFMTPFTLLIYHEG
jgi:hypothetical protein